MVNGLIIAKARVPAFIATLGMLVAARGAALTLSGGLPIAGLPREFLTLGAGYIGPFPIPTVLAAAAFVLAHGVLRRTRFGRYVYAMGSNEEAAVLSGINVAKYKMLVYITSGLFAGIAGVILTSRVISGQPTLGEVQELVLNCCRGDRRRKNQWRRWRSRHDVDGGARSWHSWERTEPRAGLLLHSEHCHRRDHCRRGVRSTWRGSADGDQEHS